MSGNGYPAHARGVASRLVGGEAVVVVAARREAHVLNETGSAAWALMDGSRPGSEIASELGTRYRVDAGVAARDLEDFVADLASRGAAAVLERRREDPRPAPGAAPAPSAYEPPAVAETHPMEVVAALCASTRTGGEMGPPSPKPGKCRADPSLCKKLFE